MNNIINANSRADTLEKIMKIPIKNNVATIKGKQNYRGDLFSRPVKWVQWCPWGCTSLWRSTVICGIFGANSSFHVKWCTTGRV